MVTVGRPESGASLCGWVPNAVGGESLDEHIQRLNDIFGVNGVRGVPQQECNARRQCARSDAFSDCVD